MIARLGNALHWAFSGVAVLLLLCAVMTIWGNPDPTGSILFVFMFLGVPALLAWLVGRGCHYVLGGDASALWERALIARARRSPGFRKVCISIVLLAVVSVAWSILDAKDREARREQQYEQQRQAEERQAAERAAAERQRAAAEREAAERAAAERAAAIAAQREAAERKAAAERAAAIAATDLSVSQALRPQPAWGGSTAMSAYETGGAMTMTGSITNNSRQTLRAVEFEVTLKDCPPGATTADDQWCRIVGQEKARNFVNIPPNQTRTFRAGMKFKNLPPDDPQRQRVYSWRIVTASSCPWGDSWRLACESKPAGE